MDQTERIAYFSQVWKQAANVFPYFDKRDLDWDQTFVSYLPRVINAASDREFYCLLAEFINLLGDGHTDFTFPRQMLEQIGYLPFSLLCCREEYYLHSVTGGNEAFLLARVTSLNGTPIRELLAQIFRYIYHVGNYAYPSKLHQMLTLMLEPGRNVLFTDKGELSFHLLKEKPELVSAPCVSAAVSCEHIPSEKLDLRVYRGDILYVRMDDFLYHNAAGEISAALKKLRQVKGLILDLRENMGGMTMYGARVAELLISGQFHGCRKRTRLMKGIDISSASQYKRMSDEAIEQCVTDGLCDRDEVERCRKINANAWFEEYTDSYGGDEHTAVYDGPCVALTSRNTISAAEDFVAMLRTNRRATVLGTPTHGSTGTPLLLPLPGGGGCRVCSVGYTLLDGTEFIGTGIQPDIFAENSVADLLNARDSVLDQALSLLK